MAAGTDRLKSSAASAEFDTKLEQSLPPWTRELLASLTPGERLVFALRELRNLTYDEIGEQLGFTRGRARQLHQHAVAKLTCTARRAALLVRGVPVVVPHARGALQACCTIPSSMYDVLELPIEALAINRRALNSLGKGEIRTIGDLVQCSERRLMQLPYFGAESLVEVKRSLGSIGLHLDMDVPDDAFEP